MSTLLPGSENQYVHMNRGGTTRFIPGRKRAHDLSGHDSRVLIRVNVSPLRLCGQQYALAFTVIAFGLDATLHQICCITMKTWRADIFLLWMSLPFVPIGMITLGL